MVKSEGCPTAPRAWDNSTYKFHHSTLMKFESHYA